ncbi:MAG: tape measure protein [Clostridia bacterium]|nr:tape measure protein [Clostridia bacterium]
MATIKSSLVLNDRMTGILRKINSSMGMLVENFEAVQTAAGQPFDVSKMNQIRQACGQINAELDEMENGQDKFNQKLAQGSSHANGLMSKIKSAVSAYALIQGAGKMLNLSDQLVQTEARLNLIVASGNSVDNLERMIYQSAQRSRASYTETADAVAKIGLSAGKAFNNNSELVLFTETLNKQFAIAGATQSEISGATTQLTQAMASGVLRGEEFNSIAEQAPGLLDLIAEEMGKPREELRSLAADGQISAGIVKNALLNAARETDKTFKTMPMTFEQVCTTMQNDAVMAFGVVSDKRSGIINSDTFQSIVGDVSASFSTIANVAVEVLDGLATAGEWVYNNWSIIAPLLGGVAAAVLAYKIAVGLSTAAEWLSTSAKIAHAIATGANTVVIGGQKVATDEAAKSQWGLNAAILASPVFWIAVVIIGVVAALIALCNWFAKTQGISTDCFGSIVGGVYVVGAAFKNIGLLIANVFLGIWSAGSAVCSNIDTAFKNAIANVKIYFYGLAATALLIIGQIAEGLNALPFVSIDYQGLYNKANEFTAKAADISANKGEYKDVGAAFTAGYNTHDVFADGWAKDAFTQGATKYNEWKAAKGSDEPEEEFNFESMLNDIAGNTGSTAGSAGKISDSLDKTNEELEWIRDIAEREVINRFTTAEVKVDFTGMTNQISNDMDLDGVIAAFTGKFKESLQTAAQGVY